MTKEEAKIRGLKRYEANVPCARCNSIIRYVTRNGCYACASKRDVARRKVWRQKAKANLEQMNALIFELNENNKSLIEIADAVNRIGYRNRCNNLYTATSISNIIEEANIIVSNPLLHAVPVKMEITLVKNDLVKRSWFDFAPDDLGARAAW